MRVCKNAELVTLLEGCTAEWKAEFKDRKTPNWDTRHWISNFGSCWRRPRVLQRTTSSLHACPMHSSQFYRESTSVCMCVHTYIYMYMCICIHKYIYIYICIYTHTYTCMCVYTYAYTYIHINIIFFIYTCIYIIIYYINICIYLYMYISLYVYMYTYILYISYTTECTNAALEYPHLEACGLGSLKATLRSTAPEAPRSALQSAALVLNLGTPCPLPFPQIVGPPSLVTGTIHQLDMQLVPAVRQEHSVDTESVPQRNKPGPRGGRSSAEREAEIRKKNPEQY